MKRFMIFAASLVALSMILGTTAWAGAKITISEDADINLGFRLQTLYLHSDKDLDGDGDLETEDDFKIRRARFRLGANVNKFASIFLQTEFSQDAGSGGDVRLIDAFVKLKPHDMAQFIIGENMAPVMRQNLTSSGGLLALDRPGLVYKNLTWGTRALSRFSNSTYSDGDAGLRGDVDVRDLGITLFGSKSLSEQAHVKYYLGIYDGIQEASTDNERIAGRVQVNFFDAEAGYYNLSTYLGKKKTVGFGLAYDAQKEVATDLATSNGADYSMYTFDVFADVPVGPGTLTFEGAYANLDLDGATMLDSDGDPLTAQKNALQSQGDGYYVQAGYYLNKWQPWLQYEKWESDATGGLGGYKSYRLGLTYFLKGHNANIKVGYETFKAEQDFSGSSEDTINTIVGGVFITY